MIKIQGIKTTQPYLKKRVVNNSGKNKDTFFKTQSPKTVQYYDMKIAQTRADLENELISCAHCEAMITSIEMKQPLVNKPKAVPKIKFKDAKTLKEARQFAYDTFNIRCFDVNDISTANFINSALSYLFNLGNIFMPREIHVKELEDKTTKGIYHEYPNEINLNSVFFNKENVSNKQKQPFLRNIIFHEMGHCCHSGNMLSNYGNRDIDEYAEKMKRHKNRSKILEENIAGYQKQRDITEQQSKNLIGKIKEFLGIKQQKTFSCEIIPVKNEYVDIWGKKEEQTAGLISEYAKTDRYEFVAETFAKMCKKEPIPDEAMKLYKESDGYLI